MKKITDTERLDWLEQTKTGLEQHYDEDQQITEWWTEETYQFRKLAPTVREAIDKAMTAQREHGSDRRVE